MGSQVAFITCTYFEGGCQNYPRHIGNVIFHGLEIEKISEKFAKKCRWDEPS